MGIKSLLFGKDPEKYVADPRASTMGGPRHDYDVGPTADAQAAQLDTGNYDQVREQQTGLANLLKGAAMGQGPMASDVAAAQARDANLANAAALQAGRRGRSAAAGARMSGVQVGMGNQAIAGQQALNRINEEAVARGQLGGVLSGIAGQDIGIAGQNAGFQQQVGLANQDAANRAALANQAAALGISQQELQARLEQERMRYGNLDPGGGGLVGGLLGAGGALVGGQLGGAKGAMAGYAAGSALGGGVSSGVRAYAKGGYVDGPTLALVGEAGPEMVVPLSPGHEDMQRAALRVLSQVRGHEAIPKMANGGIVGGSQPVPFGYQQPVQTLGIGQRVMPNFNSDQAQVNASLQFLANAVIAHELEKQDKADEAKAKAEKDRKDQERAATARRNETEDLVRRTGSGPVDWSQVLGNTSLGGGGY